MALGSCNLDAGNKQHSEIEAFLNCAEWLCLSLTLSRTTLAVRAPLLIVVLLALLLGLLPLTTDLHLPALPH